MSSIIQAIINANSPQNAGHGYLVRVTTNEGEFYRGSVLNDPRHLRSDGDLTVRLWGESGTGDGPLDKEIAVPISTIQAVEIEW